MHFSRIKTLVSIWTFLSTRDERSIFRETNKWKEKIDEEMWVDGMHSDVLVFKVSALEKQIIFWVPLDGFS